MSDMEYVEQVIDIMIQDTIDLKNTDIDMLEKSYCDCSIGTLMLLKRRLGLINNVQS